MWMRLQLWSLGRWVLLLSATVVVTVAAIVGIQVTRSNSWTDAAKTAAPIAAVIVALISLVSTSLATATNLRRQRRLDTIEAWNAWSDSCRAARAETTKLLGMGALSDDVGRALANNESIREGTIDLTDQTRRQSAVNDLVSILNGLERIANGVHLGVYDIKAIRALGGTIVVREFERGETYVNGRREATDEQRRQTRAFVALQALVEELRSSNLDEERSRLDRRRLESLRKARN